METNQFLKYGLNKCISLCLLIFISFSCNVNNRSGKYDTIISNFTGNSVYIPINIKYQDSIYRIVIKNADLYLFLDSNLSKNEYKENVAFSLETSTPLDVNSSTFNKLHKEFIKKNQYVDSLNILGYEKILASHFNENGVCIVPVSDTEQKYLIDLLFQNDIYMSVDCETGLLHIENIDFVKKKY